MSAFDLSVRFFLQMAFILAVCRATGWVFRRLGQSQVVSEMIAGVLMGPSLLGWMLPSVSAYLFPPESKPILFAVSQTGLVLYMFLVGAEFDLDLIRRRKRSAAAVSAAGILAPFALGGLLALPLAGNRSLFSEGVTLPQALLFMGASMSIGAFLMGVAMPRGLFQTELERKLLPMTAHFLLPLFFVYSGLNTRIGLVDRWGLWGLTGLVMLAAIGGKLGACTLAARWHGESWRESAAIGTLMNARGLMELILLNIGLERGIIQPPLFTILVMMAILTTLMATPLFERIYGTKAEREATSDSLARDEQPS